jgi:hypothetical protein
MADVKIGVNADGKNVAKAIEEITASVNDLAKAVASSGKVKFKPADVGTAARDIALLNKQFEIAVARSKALRDALKATGQAGKSINEVDFQKLGVNPAAAQRMRDSAFSYAARGTAWDMGPPAPSQPAPPSPRPGRGGGRGGGGTNFAATAANSFGGGVGGGFGQVIQGATRGAAAGSAEGGGMMGGLGGLLKGGGIAAAAFGLFKAGQAVSEGYDMAKERGTNLDTLKRQMGDLGVSFAGLKTMTDIASAGLGVNSKEFAALAEQYNQASHNAEKTPEGLGGAVRDATQFGRAYGIDPGASAGFFGGMQNMNPKQNNRELALQIAEAVEKGGGRAMAPDVMQFLQTMASSVSRNSLGIANTDAYSAAFGNMLGSGRTGMTTDNVSSMLGQANNAISHMGAAGEAGRNFQIGSYNKTYGQMNPMAAEALAAGGMFATPNSVFGDKNSDLSEYFRRHGGDVSRQWGGKNGNVTSWGSMKAGYESAFDKGDTGNWLRLNAVQRDLGLNSPQQAAAMMNLDEKQAGGLQNSLKRAGVSLKDLNEGGIKTMAAIGGADSHADLDKIYSQIGGRTGKDALSENEKTHLDAAQKGNTEDFRDALLKVMAGKDQEMTEAKDMLAGIKAIETAETALGDKLIGPINSIRDATLRIASVIAGPEKKSEMELGAERGMEAAKDRLPNVDIKDRVKSHIQLAKIDIKPNLHTDKAELRAEADRQWKEAGLPIKGQSGDIDQQSSDIANTYAQTGGTKAQSDIDKLMAMGWSAEQAAAIAANLQVESGSNEKAVGDNGLARGIAQWHPDRQADFAKFSGHDMKSSTHDEQLAFVNDELRNGKYKKVGDKLSHLSDANDAGSLISREYERPADAAGEASKRGRLASSLASAHDSLTIHLKVDTTGRNAQGGTSQHTIETSVPIARGSGNQTIALASQ